MNTFEKTIATETELGIMIEILLSMFISNSTDKISISSFW
jgi:hypothetical protein